MIVPIRNVVWVRSLEAYGIAKHIQRGKRTYCGKPINKRWVKTSRPKLAHKGCSICLHKVSKTWNTRLVQEWIDRDSCWVEL